MGLRQKTIFWSQTTSYAENWMEYELDSWKKTP